MYVCLCECPRICAYVCSICACACKFIYSLTVCRPWPSNIEKENKDKNWKSTFFSYFTSSVNSFSGLCFCPTFSSCPLFLTIFYLLRYNCPVPLPLLVRHVYDHCCHMSFISVIFYHFSHVKSLANVARATNIFHKSLLGHNISIRILIY